MNKTNPSRPKRVRKKPLPKVSKPEPLEPKRLEIDIAEPTKIGATPPIGADPELVTTVGLGNLKVTTARGIKNDGHTDI